MAFACISQSPVEWVPSAFGVGTGGSKLVAGCSEVFVALQRGFLAAVAADGSLVAESCISA